MLNSLFKDFDNIIIFDVETTGIDCKKDEIIEFGAIRLQNDNGEIITDSSLNILIKLSEGKKLPSFITDLTGITANDLELDGISKNEAVEKISNILNCSKPLIICYNAQFDLCFLYFILSKFGNPALLKNVKMLDALTVYKDRRAYPHKLDNAVAEYKVDTQNTHRAIDDATATLQVLLAMENEENDLHEYINLFGFNPKYGVSGPRISSIKYVEQPYNSKVKLYKKLHN